MTGYDNAIMWWITAVEIPVLAGLFWLVWHGRKDVEDRMIRLRELMETRNAQYREALSAFKLEVAKNYAAIGDLRALEVRLVSHLLRIEAKLDKTAMKTEALKAATNNHNFNHKE